MLTKSTLQKTSTMKITAYLFIFFLSVNCSSFAQVNRRTINKAKSVVKTQAPANWTGEKDFDKLIKYPTVRKVILKYASESSKKMSAQEFLGLLDKVCEPLSGISTKKISELIVPIYQELGISTGKSARKSFNQSTQQVFVKSLCSLAKNGFPLESFAGASDGLILIAKIPSDMWTWGGDIVISIEKKGLSSEVNIATKIKGQLYDWGKSEKLINSFLSDIQNIDLNI